MNKNSASEWNNFVRKNDGSVYHLFEWSKICTESLSARSLYQSINSNGKTQAVLPFISRGTLIKTVSTMPFSDGIGPLKAKNYKWSVVLQKINKDFKNEIPEMYFIFGDLPKEENLDVSHSFFTLKIRENYESIFKNKYHGKTRNMVRKYSQENVKVEIAVPTDNLIEEFYSLYAQTMKKLGAIALPKIFFYQTNKEFNKLILFSVAKLNRKIVSMLWLFSFNGKLYVWANGSDEKYLKYGSNYGVYDEAIKYACSKGMSEIIFGSSDIGSSQAFFKKRWGGDEINIYELKSDNKLSSIRKFGNITRNLIRLLPLSLYILVSKAAYKLF